MMSDPVIAYWVGFLVGVLLVLSVWMIMEKGDE